jgi:hypothetical protein
VSLITGDVVQLRTGPDGRQTAAIRGRDPHGVAGAFRTMRKGGDLYVIPAAAMPYLGRGLDPALFDVSQLARAGRTGAAARLPVRLTYRAGSAHPTVPGITVTRTQGETADGYASPATAPAFGAALTAQLQADAAAGWPAGGGIFAGLTGLRYAGPAGPPSAQPHFPMFTLRLRVTGADGQPAPFASIAVVNVDDARRYSNLVFTTDGETRISVPAGHYGLLVNTSEGVRGGSELERMVNISDYQVTKAQTLAVDMRTATERFSAHTPRPAVTDEFGLNWRRLDPSGGGQDAGFALPAGTQVLVAPGAPARFGTLQYSGGFRLSSAAGAPDPYTYDLRFGQVGSIPADLSYEVTEAELARLDVSYHTDGGPAHDALTARFSFMPWMDFGFQILHPMTAPGRRTEYVNGGKDAVWAAEFVGMQAASLDPDDSFGLFSEHYVDGSRRYAAGDRARVDWARQPARPSLNVETAEFQFRPFSCPACRDGDQLRISLTEVADTDRGHLGVLDFSQDTPAGPVRSSSRSQLFRDGVQVVDSSDVGGVDIDVPAADGRYRLVYDQTRTAPWYSLGTGSHTEWTFSSARPATSTAPAHWLCGLGEPSGNPCAVLPLLTVNYDAPLDLTGRTVGGRTHLGIDVAPTQAAPAVAIDSATVQVSFDDGLTWTAATVTGSGGHFDATFTAPAAGFVSTRVQATDAAGNGISQTITRAYALGGGA